MKLAKAIIYISLNLLSFSVVSQCTEIDSVRLNPQKTIKCVSVLQWNRYDSSAYKLLCQFDTIHFLYIGSSKVGKIPTGEKAPVIDSIEVSDVYETKTICQPVYNEFYKVKGLHYIGVNSQSIEGFPRSLLQAVNLRCICLSSPNYLKGSVPKEISQLKNLEVLEFNHTQFKNIPKDVFQLGNLQSILIECASLDTNVRIDFKKLGKLKKLYLKVKTRINWNTFFVNPEFATIQKIEISSPVFSQQLPGAIYKLSSLKEINITANSSNDITRDISALVNLRTLIITFKVTPSNDEVKRIESYLPSCKVLLFDKKGNCLER
ncbi:MAG TPA: hypothetical protein VNZ45_16565 [Bacteroidia bacterium]|jgi:hypothetical protein|nr:hypothetical protein [Bacteroidia bacterium]